MSERVEAQDQRLRAIAEDLAKQFALAHGVIPPIDELWIWSEAQRILLEQNQSPISQDQPQPSNLT